MPAYKLTYFNLRYLGEPIRLLFVYAGVSFEDVRVEWLEWNDKKLKDNYEWGKLPVLTIDDQPISQSCAIMKYLATEFGLDGESKLDKARCHEYVDCLKDLINGEWPKYLLAPNAEERQRLRQDLMDKHFPHFLGTMNNVLKRNGTKWMVGNKLTWTDFFYANFLQVFEYYTEPSLLTKYPELNRIKEQVLALPQLKEHLEKRPADPKFF